MSEVTLRIGGRSWRVACAPGEEDRVQRLGATVGEKLDAMGGAGAADAQNMLFAALMLADEVLESREGASSASSDVHAARQAAEDAAGECDRLRGRIAELESDLSRLHTAQNAAAHELDRALTQERELRGAIADHEAQASRMRGELVEAREERDAARAAPPPHADEPALSLDDAAPALERFAQMLEECADKLESRARDA